MDITKEKVIIKKQIDKIEDEESLKMLKTLIDFMMQKKYFTPMSIDAYNLKLAESEEAYNMGKTTTHKQLLNEVENWKEITKK